jgi:HEAT repeat protein
MSPPKPKLTAALTLIAGCVAAVAGGLPCHLSAEEPASPVKPTPASDRVHSAAPVWSSGTPDAAPAQADTVKREVALLKKDLKKALARIDALERRLDGEGTDDLVLYHGMPARFWMRKLEDRDPEFRQQALQALAGIAQKDPAVIPVLVHCLKDRDHQVVSEASRILGQDIGRAAVPGLVEALDDPDSRSAAMLSLRWIGPPAKAAVPALIHLLGDRSEDVREDAAAALCAIGPDAKAAVPALIEALKYANVSPGVRWQATAALGQIGPEAKAAVPALLEALQAPGNEAYTREDFRKMATEALEAIGPVAATREPPAAVSPRGGGHLP